MRMKPIYFVALIVACLCAPAHSGAEEEPAGTTRIVLTYDKEVARSFSGRVYLFFGSGRQEPRFGPNWFGPAPFYAQDVVDWKPGTPLTLSNPSLAFPRPLAKTPDGQHQVQAVMRLNPHVRQVGRGAGNAYSKVAAVEMRDGAMTGTLHIDQVVQRPRFRETERVKEHALKSKLLSTFHKRDVTMRAAVVLPPGYEKNPKRRYPALYIIPGFGGTHHQHRSYLRNTGSGHDADIVRILLNPSCAGGHHVFADSANNGPWSRALVEELIPDLEKRYRLVAAPTARFLTGISSGGWSSLWLQVVHPTFFGGTWSFAPDPVDFHDFQQIDLYKPRENMFRDAEGDRRPLARHNGRVMVWYDMFVAMETVLGEGGQIRSFEWVFSARGADGKPVCVFDRKTGAVDTKVAKTWEAYDIRLILKRNWRKLAPKLKNKIHVFMGGKDTFYLDGATRRLAKTMKDLKSDAVIEIHEEHNHSSIYNRTLRARMETELMQRFVKAHPRSK